MAERQTRVLMVEDDPNIVDLIRSNLTVRGFDTVVSTDGTRAPRRSASSSPSSSQRPSRAPSQRGKGSASRARVRISWPGIRAPVRLTIPSASSR